jgi:hypothetical protein
VTNQEAAQKALRVYKLAQKQGRLGNWEEADILTNVFAGDCSFCEANERDCGACPVEDLCFSSKNDELEAQYIAQDVLAGYRTEDEALQAYDVVIARLEELAKNKEA